MRTPFLSLVAAAAFLVTAAPALAHDGEGAVNCPLQRHHAHHVRHECPCPPRITHETHRRVGLAEGRGGGSPASARGEEEYGRQNFSWAPTGPGDERPGPSTWRPGAGGRGLYSEAPPPAVYAERGPGGSVDHFFAQRGGDQRDRGERDFGDRFRAGQDAYGERHDDQGDRDDRYARGGGAYFGGEEYGRRDGAYAEGDHDGGRDFDHRFEQHGPRGHEYAFGYSREEERRWSSREGGAFGEQWGCPCGRYVSATDQYGFLTWPGKTHFWRGQAVNEQPTGGAPWADDPQGPVVVRP